MPTKSELMNDGECLGVTLGQMKKHGVQVDLYSYDNREEVFKIEIKPLMKCDTCRRLSPATECLWCEEVTHDLSKE